MCVWWHYAISCTSISVLKRLVFFAEHYEKKKFLNLSYFTLWFIVRYNKTLSKGRSFQLYIACQAPFLLPFSMKDPFEDYHEPKATQHITIGILHNFDIYTLKTN